MFVEIRNAITGMLEARTSLTDEPGKPFASSYAYHKLELNYPAVTFEPSDVKSDYETNTQNFRQYAFRIFIHQDTEGEDRDQAIGYLLAAVDTLLNDFDKSDNLNGLVDKLEAMPMDIGYYSPDKGQTVMVAEMRIVCGKSIDVV